MSLVLLVCNCSNSETNARRVLERANVPNYMGVPVRKGRQAVRQYLDAEHDDANVEVRKLKAYIANRAKFSVVAGFNENQFEWSDANNGMEGSMRAEVIAETFA